MPLKCKSKSLIHKLYARELYGGFTKKLTVSAEDLFDRVPEEQILNLSQVFEDLGDHVFMGTTLCGKFLMTYSIKRTEYLPDFGLYGLIYILHFWSFSRAPLQSKKVAKVHLFSGFSSEITTELNITVAQWPTVQDRLIVYGETELNCPSTGDYHTSNTFLTITHLPSLESCPRCQYIAEMYQHRDPESNISTNNNQCLKHGVALDVMFMLAHPHPKLDIRNSKFPNRFLVNTGNFLHIISMELHNTDVSKTPCSMNNNSEEIVKPILNVGQDYKVTHDLHKVNPSFKFLHLEERTRKRNSSILVRKDEQENFNIRKLSTSLEKKEHTELRSGENIMAEADKIYAFQEFEDGSELKFKCLKWFRKRKLADKMYEFDEIDDDEMENTRFSNLLKELQKEYEYSSKPKTSKVSLGRFLTIRLNAHSKSQESSRKPQYSLCEKDNTCDTVQNVNHEIVTFPPQTDSLRSELFLKTDSFGSKPDNCDVSSIISDWESQDTASLSPKSDISNMSDFSTSSTSDPSSGIRFSLKLKKPRYSLKKYTRTHTPGCQVDIDKHANKATLEKSLCVILKPHNRLYYPIEDNIKSPPNRIEKRFPESNQNNLITGCCNDFERYYIVNDIEDNQITTESEMDCSEDGNQVPIIVRSPSQPNTKLKLIPDPSDVDKSEFSSVKQKTLDIEQFCFKAADLICKKESYKFRSCNDYDVEVVSVCPVSGDVMAAVSIRMNAVYSRMGSPFKNYSSPDCSNRFPQSICDLRKEFDTCCILIWNVDTLVCRVEAYTPLQPVVCNISTTEWVNCTFDMAQDLRFQHIGYFNVPCLMPRSVDHRVMIEKNGEEIYNSSIIELHDKTNLTGFRLDKKYVIQGNEADSDVNHNSDSLESDPENEMDDILLS